MAETGKKKHKKRNPTASLLLTIGIIACAGVIAFAAFKLVSTWLEYRKGVEEYDGLRQYTQIAEGAGEPEEPEEEEILPAEPIEILPVADEDDMRTRRKPPIDVDWTSLKKINEDIIGWLYIGALDVSYPVVQGEDDDYYLHRTFKRQDNFAGSIFVEAENSRDFTDHNTIVYGHNMMNGSMFGTLSHLTSEEKYKDDPYFWILTPKGNYRYRMFSLHVTEISSDVYTLFSGADRKFLDWCNRMQAASSVKTEREKFTIHSKVVTLSTCTGDSAKRYVVQGLAIRD